jgi:hypothetical protein
VPLVSVLSPGVAECARDGSCPRVDP